MILSNSEYNEVLKTLRNEKKISEASIFCKTKIHMNRTLQFCDNEGTYQCSAGDKLITILANGDILPCRRLPISFGNVLEKTILESYNNSELIKDLRKKEIPKECNSCLKKEQCRGGAKCLSHALFNDYNLRDYNCNVL